MVAERQRSQGDWQLYRRLLSYVVPYWYLFVLSTGGFVLYSLGNVLLADLLQYLLDSVSGSGEQGRGLLSRVIAHTVEDGGRTPAELARIVVPVTLIMVTLVRAAGFFAGSYFVNCVARNLIHELRCRLFDSLLQAPSYEFESQAQGKLVSKVTFNIEQVTGAATRALKTLLRESLTLLALVSYMLYLNWRLCLLFLAIVPAIAWVVTLVGKRFRRYSRRIQVSMGDVTQVTAETIRNIQEVRLYGGEATQRQQFRRASSDNREQSLKLAFAEALSTPIIQLLLALSLAALIWFALSPQVLTGFSAGSLVAFLTAAAQLGKPVRQLSGIQSVLQRGLAAAEDVFAQMDESPEPTGGSLRIERARGDLALRGVSFCYPDSDHLALSELNLEIAAGETLALVGPSGSGKSTLVKLLARLYEPQTGTITLDGRPLSEYAVDNLRQQLGFVSQHAPLFHDTVYNNIAYGAIAKAERSRVTSAIQAAHAQEFIDRLPRGLDTDLGDDGGGLSGGQRQRIALARAVLKDAPVLIMDEATSGLDSASRARLQEAMNAVMRGRTVVVIAHRLEIAQRADRIAVMDSGRVVEIGNHRELVERGGLYHTLWQQEERG
ncbi:MAG: lipid A export permease/ATP-binding protein MsbA [Pseudomonadota bacterium]